MRKHWRGMHKERALELGNTDCWSANYTDSFSPLFKQLSWCFFNVLSVSFLTKKKII